MSDPRIPRALTLAAVVGVVAMYRLSSHIHTRCPARTTHSAQEPYALVPADFQTIYNLNPLYRQGINGTGQTIYVVESSTISSAADMTSYRCTFSQRLDGQRDCLKSDWQLRLHLGQEQRRLRGGSGCGNRQRHRAQRHHRRRGVYPRPAECRPEPGQLRHTPVDHQHELRRVRSIQRRDRQCIVQHGIPHRRDGWRFHLRLHGR